MLLTKKQKKKFEKVCKPVIDFINKNGDPYTRIIIDPRSAEWMETVNLLKTDVFLND
jgi:hypothetical protein